MSAKGLVICSACSGAVALSAATCPACGASVEIREMNGAGCLGLLLLVGSCPLTIIGGPIGLILTAVAVALIATGRGRRVRTSAVRVAGPGDRQRLAIPPDQFATELPFQSTAALIAAALLVPLTCVYFATVSSRGPDARSGGIDLGASVSVTCSVGGRDGHRCQFTNAGITPGTRCVVVTLRHRRSAELITSQQTCSGLVLPGDTSERSVMFVGRQPRELCGGSIESNCEMEIGIAGESSATPPVEVAETASLCGDPTALGASSRTNWTEWSCQTEGEVTAWGACVARATYAADPGRGCPGDERCCPPPEVRPLGLSAVVTFAVACEVRDAPNAAAGVVGRAPAGVSYVDLEARGEWHRVRLADGTEGWAGCAVE